MGFFEDHPQAPSGLNYVSAEEKKVLAAEGVPLTVISVGIGAGCRVRPA